MLLALARQISVKNHPTSHLSVQRKKRIECQFLSSAFRSSLAVKETHRRKFQHNFHHITQKQQQQKKKNCSENCIVLGWNKRDFAEIVQHGICSNDATVEKASTLDDVCFCLWNQGIFLIENWNVMHFADVVHLSSFRSLLLFGVKTFLFK